MRCAWSLIILSLLPTAVRAEESGLIRVMAATLRETIWQIWVDFAERLPFIIAGLLLVVLTWLIAWLFSLGGGRLLDRFRLRPSLRELFLRLISIGIWVVGLLLAIMVVFPGIDPANALGALGIVSLAVGFAFRDIFENFFAGVLILWRFPFENGDYLEVEGITGRVVDVTARMTLVRQVSGELVVLPNSLLFKNPVRIYTDRPRRRTSIIAGIAYGEDVERAVQVIEGGLKDCTTIHHDQPVQVFPHGFGDSSIDIEVTWWTDPRPVDLRRSRGEVVTAVKKSLDGAGIEIPFPYRTLTFKEPLQARLMPAGSAKAVSAPVFPPADEGEN